LIDTSDGREPHRRRTGSQPKEKSKLHTEIVQAKIEFNSVIRFGEARSRRGSGDDAGEIDETGGARGGSISGRLGYGLLFQTYAIY
jgi:hypothetical protein